MIVTAISRDCRYGEDKPCETISHSIDIEIGDKVIFIDNSYLRKVEGNNKLKADSLFPAGILTGIVKAVDGKETARFELTKIYGIVEMPITVLLSNGDSIYANPLNIKRA